MAIYLTELDPDKLWFPSTFDALSDPNGLLAFGGDLSAERLILAYQNGIFPWYGPGEPILWWSPSPRAVFDPKTFQPAKSLKKFQRKLAYRVTINHATEQVIDYCASTRSKEETWLNEEMRSAYKTLAQQRHCHSVEVWHADKLIGGLYGISIGQVFCGESMFSLETNASKIALWYFCRHFEQHGGKLIDCQVLNPHLASLGAIELNREDFIQTLLSYNNEPLLENCFLKQQLTSESWGE
ncbi:leucyl/phenylalanyl-tRNA--protein transferase [Vibrio tubiashii]|uniref:leucyl/phenylalanyl-tRNA--protein transferase n=1 Tax=Vibrio tubiashii TaxID=29498 RepID=UPI001EFED4BB|nr:leucyl/phenylalanyl-tRNA--protein transferase [Vibrio tubiashii]MCG9583056.1 leucyl/phenylalanyl-tRNA--protein transferase [Vibrio tubiashii]MCG9616650.1 leucyl/phenylalanyl-tRNA--protein transferase [Vibrio tubiashii]MCG9689327.1 leucyl/phenylalanyl-tRNA--protein transferase [Vibrio tubiashii]